MDKRKAVYDLWNQMNKDLTFAQVRSLQRLNEAFDGLKKGFQWESYSLVVASLVLAARNGVNVMIAVRSVGSGEALLGVGHSEIGKMNHVIFTSPEEAAFNPNEKCLRYMKLDKVLSLVIQDPDCAGLWMNPLGGHCCSIVKEDLATWMAIADLGLLEGIMYRPEITLEEKEKSKKGYFPDLHSGEATFLVCEPGIGDWKHPVWEWLREEGFCSWGHHGNFGANWVFINVNSKTFAPGMPGIRLASPVRNHAITLDEFRTVWNIYRKYDGLDPLVMPGDKKNA